MIKEVALKMFVQFSRDIVKSLLITLMIALLSITTYGASWLLIMINSVAIFILSLVANVLGDIIFYYFEKKKELKELQEIKREVRR